MCLEVVVSLSGESSWCGLARSRVKLRPHWTAETRRTWLWGRVRSRGGRLKAPGHRDVQVFGQAVGLVDVKLVTISRG